MWVERSRMVDGFDGYDVSVGHQIERTGVDDVVEYDYPGKRVVPFHDFCPESEFWHKIDGERLDGFPSFEGW